MLFTNPLVVVPVKSGTQEKNLDSRFRGNDGLKEPIRQDFENYYSNHLRRGGALKSYLRLTDPRFGQ